MLTNNKISPLSKIRTAPGPALALTLALYYSEIRLLLLTVEDTAHKILLVHPLHCVRAKLEWSGQRRQLQGSLAWLCKV